MKKNLINFIKSIQKEEVTVMENLDNHTIFITGANRGVGFALAETLYKLGASLVLFSRNISQNEKLKSFDSARVLLIEGDVGKEEDVKKAIIKALDKFGKIDVLINNAGQFIDKSIDECTTTDFNKLINTSLKGTFLMAKEVVSSMKLNKNGLIINIGSKISHNTKVEANKVLYAAAKYGVEGFSYALNRELKSYGIRVVCLMPATINTFLTVKPKKFLSVNDVIAVILIVIYFKNIDFEGIIFKSRFQDI